MTGKLHKFAVCGVLMCVCVYASISEVEWHWTKYIYINIDLYTKDHTAESGDLIYNMQAEHEPVEFMFENLNEKRRIVQKWEWSLLKYTIERCEVCERTEYARCLSSFPYLSPFSLEHICTVNAFDNRYDQMKWIYAIRQWKAIFLCAHFFHSIMSINHCMLWNKSIRYLTEFFVCSLFFCSVVVVLNVFSWFVFFSFLSVLLLLLLFSMRYAFVMLLLMFRMFFSFFFLTLFKSLFTWFADANRTNSTRLGGEEKKTNKWK